MKKYIRNIIIVIYLIVIYCWIPIEIFLFGLIDWQTCAKYPFNEFLQGKYFHYIILIVLETIGLIYSIRNKNYILMMFICLNFYFFIVLYSIDSQSLLDEYGFNCTEILRTVN